MSFFGVTDGDEGVDLVIDELTGEVDNGGLIELLEEVWITIIIINFAT